MPSTDHNDATQVLQTLIGQSLEQICVGVGDVQLRFSGDEVFVGLGSGVRTAPHRTVVAPNSLEGLALLVPLLNGDVAAVHIDDRGGLSLVVGGTTLHCPESPEFEAWSLSGPSGVLVVSMPGGDLAVWSAGSAE